MSLLPPGGLAGRSRPARLYVHLLLTAITIVFFCVGQPSPVAAQQSWRILLLRVDFPLEEPDEPTTSGLGGFDLRPLVVALDDYQLPYDTPPHDRAHYEHHMQALASYYTTVSEGQIVIEAEVFPRLDTLVYTLPTSALRYGNGRTPEEIGRKWRELAVDAVTLAEADPEGPRFADYDSYLIIHAGLGHETGALNDVRSVYLGPADLIDYGGPLAVDDGTHLIDNLMILPESVDNRGRAGLNGLLAKFFGHQLGAPGLSNFADGLPGVGGWSLMDVGANRIGFILHGDELDYMLGTVPPHPLSWTKARLGWIEPTTIRSDTTVTILAGDRAPSAGSAATRVVRVPLSPTESIWLENRQQRARTEFDLPAGVVVPFAGLELGWIDPTEAEFSHTITAEESEALAGREAGVWLGTDEYDAFIPSSGILAWHVDDAVISSAPEGFNNDRERPGLVLMEADGYRDIGNFYFDRQDLTEGTRSDALYAGVDAAGAAGVGEIGPGTSPDTRTNTGLDTGIRVEILSPPGDSMRVRLHFGRSLASWPRSLPGVSRLQALDSQANGGIQLIATGGGETVLFWTRPTPDVRLTGTLLAAGAEGLFLSTTDGISAHQTDGAPRWAVLAADKTKHTHTILSESLAGTGSALVTAGDGGLIAWEPQSGAKLFEDDLPVTGLSAGDSDGDGEVELIALGPQGVRRYHGSVATVIDAGAGPWLPPASGDLDGDGAADLVLLDRLGRLSSVGQAIDIDVRLGAVPTGAPALADIDGDGRLEIVVLTQQQLHVITAGGLAAAAFPATIPTHHEAGQLFGEPVAGDLDGNGAQEIYAAASIGIYGIGADGDLLPGFPLLTSASPVYTPLLADIDGDGAVDVAAAADDAVYVWQPLSWNGDFASGTASAWAQAGGTAAGTRAYFAALGDPPSTQTGQLLPAARSYCYPNPVDGDTDKATVRFYLARDASVTLHVYDAIGTQVDRLAAADLRGAAENEVSWSTDGYSSGLYLCRLTATGVDGSRGEVTLRMAVSR